MCTENVLAFTQSKDVNIQDRILTHSSCKLLKLLDRMGGTIPEPSKNIKRFHPCLLKKSKSNCFYSHSEGVECSSKTTHPGLLDDF